MITVQSCCYSDTHLCEQIFKIRSEVFVVEQAVDRDEEFDKYESSSIHYLSTIDDTPAGTARWRITENGIKLERFAVLIPYRKKGVAAAILKKVLADVSGADVKIYLNAQITAVEFYKKFGFEIEGERFIEANIEHYTMFLKR